MGPCRILVLLVVAFAAAEISEAGRVRTRTSQNQISNEEPEAGSELKSTELEADKSEAAQIPLAAGATNPKMREESESSSPPLPSWLHTAFDSSEGLTLRAAAPSERGVSRTVSASVFRSDLPIALHAQKPGAQDSAGVIFVPNSTQVLCAYPVNALTDGRANDEGRDDQCGKTKNTPFSPLGNMNVRGMTDSVKAAVHEMSGQCNFSTPEEFVAAYYNKPNPSNVWLYQFGVCHFTKVPEMLSVQKMMLDTSNHTPDSVFPSLPAASRRALWENSVKFALTAFNEVVVAPHDASAVGGIFWAHSGTFREPQPTDPFACKIAKFVNGDTSTLPIFEVAGVAFSSVQDPPFGPCEVDLHNPKPVGEDCLSEGMKQWKANLTEAGGKRPASSVFRTLEPVAFVKLTSMSCGHLW